MWGIVFVSCCSECTWSIGVIRRLLRWNNAASNSFSNWRICLTLRASYHLNEKAQKSALWGQLVRRGWVQL